VVNSHVVIEFGAELHVSAMERHLELGSHVSELVGKAITVCHSHVDSSSRREAPSAMAMAMILRAIPVVRTGPTAAQPQWRPSPPPQARAAM